MEIFQIEGDWRDMRTKPWPWTAGPGRQSVFIDTDLKKIKNLIHSVDVSIKYEVGGGCKCMDFSQMKSSLKYHFQMMRYLKKFSDQIMAFPFEIVPTEKPVMTASEHFYHDFKCRQWRKYNTDNNFDGPKLKLPWIFLKDWWWAWSEESLSGLKKYWYD